MWTVKYARSSVRTIDPPSKLVGNCYSLITSMGTANPPSTLRELDTVRVTTMAVRSTVVLPNVLESLRVVLVH